MQLRPHLKSFREWIIQILNGVCMGAADLVPGVSGGTMALILGIYEEFIFSIKSFGSKAALSLFSLNWKRFHREVSWDFLLGLIVGAALAFALLSQGIQAALGDPATRRHLYSVFVGMILFSMIICYSRIKNRRRSLLIVFLLGAVITYLATGYRTEPWVNGPHYNVSVSAEEVGDLAGKSVRNYDQSRELLLNVSREDLSAMLSRDLIVPETAVQEIGTGKKGPATAFASPQERGWLSPWLIMCGAVAVSAMLLPGVSGSYLLNVLGAYAVAVGALADFFREGDGDAFFTLCNLGIGIVIGALLVSRLIAFLLERYHDGMMALLIGFMAGSLHTIWPFFTYDYTLNPLKLDKGPVLQITGTYSPSYFNPEMYVYAFFFLLGFGAVYLLEAVSKKRRPVPPE